MLLHRRAASQNVARARPAGELAQMTRTALDRRLVRAARDPLAGPAQGFLHGLHRAVASRLEATARAARGLSAG